MSDAQALGMAIRSALERARISPSDVARRIGVKPQSVSGWLSGKSPPTTPNLIALMRIIGVTLDAEVHLRMISSSDGGLSIVAGGDDVSEFSFNDAIKALSGSKPGAPKGLAPIKLLVVDQANAPVFRPGDAVVIDPQVRHEPGDMVIIAKDGTTPLFRKFTAQGAVALNPDWVSLPIPIEGETRVLGVMIEHRIPRRR